jgi:hypothetical protein
VLTTEAVEVYIFAVLIRQRIVVDHVSAPVGSGVSVAASGTRRGWLLVAPAHIIAAYIRMTVDIGGVGPLVYLFTIFPSVPV